MTYCRRKFSAQTDVWRALSPKLLIIPLALTWDGTIDWVAILFNQEFFDKIYSNKVTNRSDFLHKFIFEELSLPCTVYEQHEGSDTERESVQDSPKIHLGIHLRFTQDSPRFFRGVQDSPRVSDPSVDSISKTSSFLTWTGRDFCKVYRMSRIKADIGKLPYLGFWARNASSLWKIWNFLIATY